MWYILYMNKDIVYIEPEDDITDIITKIEKSKSKIVALVPPKKAGILRSIVNIKLISKAATAAEKTAVLVTTDPSIVKLAAATKIPVTKNLQSAPSIPTLEETDNTSSEELREPTEDAEDTEGEETTEDENEVEEETEKEAEETEKTEDDEDAEEKKPAKDKKASAKKSKSLSDKKNKFISWIKDHKKLAIFSGVGILILILMLIWAFAIAPAVNIFVSIKTDANNFSEAVSFVKEQSQENIKEGKIYLEERKIETTNEVEFEATGQKNIGEKATGDLVVYSYFSADGANPVNAGTVFKLNGLSYVASENITLSWQGDLTSCENKDKETDPVIDRGKIKCLISGRVKVTAAEPGSKYNVPASSTGWDTVANVAVYSDKAMSGGTDDIITVVQQSDVEKAKNELGSSKESENKEKLYETIPDDALIVESTFDQTTSKAVSTPAVDEEVKDGVKPTLKTTTTTSVYTIDKAKLEELIKEKINLPEDKKIFEIRNVYIDGFKESDDGLIGKLKAVYFTGPRITETELVEKIMGKGIGDARREIKDIDGVSDVKMDPSHPWVMRVPKNSNKISMTFEIKDQEGNKIEEKDEKSEESEEKTDDETDEQTDDSKKE